MKSKDGKDDLVTPKGFTSRADQRSTGWCRKCRCQGLSRAQKKGSLAGAVVWVIRLESEGGENGSAIGRNGGWSAKGALSWRTS